MRVGLIWLKCSSGPTMSHDNSINKLQEFCQKNKLSLPCYTDEPVINGIFKINCSVIIQGKEIIGKGDGLTKKDARKNAAAQCMTIITFEVLNRFNTSNSNSGNSVFIIINKKYANLLWLLESKDQHSNSKRTKETGRTKRKRNARLFD